MTFTIKDSLLFASHEDARVQEFKVVGIRIVSRYSALGTFTTQFAIQLSGEVVFLE